MSHACVPHVKPSVTCHHRARDVSPCMSSCITMYHTCQTSSCRSHRVCRRSSCISRAVMRVTRLCPVVVQSQCLCACVCVCGAAGCDTIHIACDVIIQVMCHGAYHMSSMRVMYIPSHISQGIMSCMRIIAHITRQRIPSHTSHVITHI